MEQLIPVINKLQDVFNSIGGEQIDLPQIVVIGSQSSGKSSVLENIVGKDFLPRGAGIVTRRPLILQLIHLDKKGGNRPAEEWGEFLHRPNQIYTDFEEIRREIAAETDKGTKNSKSVSPVPIRLRIYSPHVLNLTVIDLPGMTKVPVDDQPFDIGEQIRKMIIQFISNPNSIILSVTAANTDIANSDGIQLAKEIDPEGLRHIGVITKLDIMDKGTDAMDVLCNRVIPLKLGFVGLVNRSQADINSRKPIRESLRDENNYFSSHPVYRQIANRLGTSYLTKLLNKVLMNHIRDCLPELKSKIAKMINDTQVELDSYGGSMMENRGALLLQILTKFSNDYCDTIDGKNNEAVSVNELMGGARINYIFNEIYSKCLDSIQPNDDLTVSDIRTAIKNATGPKGALFVPEASFELLARRQIAKLEDPSLQCVELVYDELQRIVSQLENKDLQRFQTLKDRVVETVNNLLKNCKVPTRKMILNLIEIENAYINTNHCDFVGGGGAISNIFETMSRNQQDQQQQQIQQQQQQQPPNPNAGNPLQNPNTPNPNTNPNPNNPNLNPNHPNNPNLNPNNPNLNPNNPNLNPNNPNNPGGNQGFFNRFFGNQPGQPGGPGGPGGPGPMNPNNPNNRPAVPPFNQPQNPNLKPMQPAPFQPNRPGLPPNNNQQFAKTPYDIPPSPGGLKGVDRLDQVPITIKANPPTNEKEKWETELIQNLLSSYFDIVRTNIADLIPKSIMHFLVNMSKEHVQNELVRHLYKEELFDELLEENPVISARRKQCKQMLEVLFRASEVLMEVRDFNPSGYL